MKLFCITLLLLTILAGRLSAQPGGEVQPDRIAFGTLYTGATAEASFLVWEPGKDTDIKLEVTAPKFVKVLNKTTHTGTYGARGDLVGGTVEIAIDTAATGDLKGEVSVRFGRTTAKVPVSASVKPRRPGLHRLLIAETPFDRYSTKDGDMFQAWTDLVKGASVDVSYLEVTEGKPVLRDLDLSKFNCVLLASSGLYHLQPADIKKVRAFAEAGGRVVVAANAFFGGTVKQANMVLDGYGLQVRNEEASAAGQTDVTLGPAELDPELVKAGLRSVHFFRASPVGLTEGKSGRVLARAVGVGQSGDGFVATSKAGKGRVIALGESLWCFWITDSKAAGADNARLLQWLLVDPIR